MSNACKILYRKNLEFSKKYKNLLIDPTFYLLYGRSILEEDKTTPYSSFNNLKNTSQEAELLSYCNNFYAKITSEFLKEYNLRKGSECNFGYWWQLYNNNTHGHGDHTHFDSSLPIIFSFVHFINVDKNDSCFHFVNEDGSEEYINESQNDFIIFGSWMRHRVKTPKSETTRAVVAGNISIDKHISHRQYYN